MDPVHLCKITTNLRLPMEYAKLNPDLYIAMRRNKITCHYAGVVPSGIHPLNEFNKVAKSAEAFCQKHCKGFWCEDMVDSYSDTKWGRGQDCKASQDFYFELAADKEKFLKDFAIITKLQG